MSEKISKNSDWDLKVNFCCNNCGFFESRADGLVVHTIEKHCDGKFWCCFFCRKYSSDQKANLVQHMRDKHTFTEDLFICPLCFKIGIKEDEFDSHIIRDHWSVKKVQCCKLCSYKCEDNIIQHIKKKHVVSKFCEPGLKGKSAVDIFQYIMNNHFPKLDSYYTCPYCDAHFDKENSANQHCLDKHGYERFLEDDSICVDIICTLCDNYTCQKKETFHKHTKTKHCLITFDCPFGTCSYKIDKFWKFAAHVAYEHISSREFKCAFCSSKFSKEKSFEQHIENKHSPMDFRPVCTCTPFQFGSVRKHMEKHHDFPMGNFICKLCNSQSSMCSAFYFDMHLSLAHGVNFPRGIEELYDED